MCCPDKIQHFVEQDSVLQVEISEIDGRLAEQYEAKLQQSLQELRDQYEGQMRANREEIELLYENKIKNLTSHAQRNSGAANLAIEELRQTRARIDSLNQRINELEASNNALNSRIRFVDSSDSSQFCTLSKRISLIVVVNMLKGLGELARERESSSYRRFGRVGG